MFRMELAKMQTLILVPVGLLFFLWYDVCTVREKQGRWHQLLFTAGLLCDGAVTVWMLAHSAHVWSTHPARTIVCCAAALFFLGLLIYTLFFALPFDKTYVDPVRKRSVCQSGMYALCRHPGVIWFILFYAALYGAAPEREVLWGGVLLCASDLVYIVVQDLWTFPRTFCDYEDYRKSVPFLIPTLHSIRRAWQTRP